MNTTIPIFPKLYKCKQMKKQSKVLSTLLWEILIEEVNTKNNTYYNIVTIHGLLDGKLIRYEKAIKSGKASRTALQQATLEANRKWINKKEQDGYVENIDDCTNILDSDHTLFVSPMLATVYVEGKTHIDYPVYVQRKYDGIRCLIYMDENNNVIMESRNKHVFENMDNIRKEIIKLYETLFTINNNIIFDGELYSDDLTFSQISGTVRLDKITTSERNNSELSRINKIYFNIYDIIDLDNINMPYYERLDILSSITNIITTKTKQEQTLFNKYIKITPTDKANNINDIIIKHDQYVSEGYEGLIIRTINGTYELNKRSKFLYKYVHKDSDEFVVIGFHDGTGHEEGLVIWECKMLNGTIFSVKPEGTVEERAYMYKHALEYIGKKLTVEYRGIEDGKPRFAIGKGFRFDLS